MEEVPQLEAQTSKICEGKTVEELNLIIQNDEKDIKPEIKNNVSIPHYNIINLQDIKNNNLAVNKRSWSPEEDSLLLELGSKDSKLKWRSLVKFFPNKTAQQISYRYNKLTMAENKKWSRNEDIIIVELIEIYGQNWDVISSKMPGRSPEEIQERFELKLNPNLKRSKFDKEEDDLILKLYSTYGNQWTTIAKHFKDRNASMIKNRFYSSLKNNKDGHSFKSDQNLTLYGANVSKENSIIIIDQCKDASYKSNSELIIEKFPFLSKKASTSEDINFDLMLIDDSFNKAFSSVSYDMSDIDLIKPKKNIFFPKEVVNSTDDVNIKLKSSYLNEVYLNHSESNNIPTEQFENTDSPKSSFLKENTNEHFNEQFETIFKPKNNSFDIDDETQKPQNQDATQNMLIISNESLLTQYKMLEEILVRVNDLSNDTIATNNNPVNEKFLTLNKKIDEKREKLSQKLLQLKSAFLNIEGNRIDPETYKASIIEQIEILMELIKATKNKINLLSHSTKQEAS